MKTIEVKNSLFWGLIIFNIAIVVALIGQINRTGELYKQVKEAEKKDTVVWIEGGNILKAHTIDSLQKKVDTLQEQVNKSRYEIK